MIWPLNNYPYLCHSLPMEFSSIHGLSLTGVGRHTLSALLLTFADGTTELYADVTRSGH